MTKNQVGFWSIVCLCMCVSDSCELCRNGWTDRDSVWDVDSCRPDELFGAHICAVWPIQLKDPCLAAMQAVATITVATCLIVWPTSAGTSWNNQ